MFRTAAGCAFLAAVICIGGPVLVSHSDTALFDIPAYSQKTDVSLRTLNADKAFPIACRSVSPSLRPNIARIL